MKYQVVALDLDGTLLNNDKSVSEANKQAVREAHSRGVQIVLASGRNVNRLSEYEKDLGTDCFLLGYNGAKCITTQASGRQVLFHHPLSPETTNFVLQYCEKNSIFVNINLNEKVYGVDSPNNRQLGEVFHVLTTTVFEWLPNYTQLYHTTPTKLLLIANSFEHREKIYSELDGVVPSAHLIKTHCRNQQHHQYYVEVMQKDVNKGFGLTQLCDRLGLPLSSLAAFGDDDNDAEMLRVAGLGICLSQGSDLARSSADRISQFSNQDDGVAKELWALLVGTDEESMRSNGQVGVVV